MSQVVLSVVLEVQPQSAERLTQLIEDLRKEEENPPKGQEKYSRLMAGVPVLHFMSLSVFPSPDYDPLFVLEANFDGSPGVFWAQIEATLGPALRDMVRCAK